MKLYKKIICGVAATLSVAALQSCSEEKATLEGANTVYIELAPKEVSMAVGDTVLLSAVISNEAGDIINTPVTWSVDDPDFVELTEQIKYVDPKNSRAEGDEETGDEPGEDDPLDPDQPGVDEPSQKVEVRTPCIVAKLGSQNKTTYVRATLENGMYAIAPVSIIARDLSKAVTPQTTFKRAYSRTALDTIWFNVTPFALVDESEIKFEMEVTERITDDPNNGEFVNPKVYIDREMKRVGVVYTGPRLTGKGECRLWLESGGLESEKAVVPVGIYPLIWPGFEVDGKRPNYGPPTPSNIKITLMNKTIDVNSTYDIGVCLGIDAGSHVEIENVMAAEKAGMMYWTVDGSAVVVEDSYWDENYESGYVSYLKVRSGQRTGLSVIKFQMPDTVLTCNLQVDDFNKTYPVERIVVTHNDKVNEPLDFYLGAPASIEVGIEPDASWEFHIPEITVADPSILTVDERDTNAGLTRTFSVKRTGSTTVTFTALDKTLTLPVTVHDRVDYIQWDNNNPSEVYVNTTHTIKANPHWASGKPFSGQVNWTVSDESVVRLTPVGENGEATIEALKEGTVDIVAEYEGTTSSRYTLNVVPAQDVKVGDYETRIFGDAGNGNLYFVVGDNSEIYAELPFVTEGEFAGTFTGTAAHVELNGTLFEGCSYNLTITEAGEDEEGNMLYTVSGTISLPIGSNIVFNGEKFILG